MISDEKVADLCDALDTAATVLDNASLDDLHAGRRASFDNLQRMVTNWRALIAEIRAQLPPPTSADPLLLL